MPYYAKAREETLTDCTVMQDDETGFYKVNTDDGGYYPYHQAKELTIVFFDDFAELLGKAKRDGLDVTVNKDEKSFTLFGQKFYCLCIETKYCASSDGYNDRYNIRPIFYKENFECNAPRNIYEEGDTYYVSYSGSANATGIYIGDYYGRAEKNNYLTDGTYFTNLFLQNFNGFIHDYHINYRNSINYYCYPAVSSYCGPYTYGTAGYGGTGYGYGDSFLGFNLEDSIVQDYDTRNIARYKVKIYFKEDWLFVTYMTTHDAYIEEKPIGFFIKGYDYRNKEIMLTCLNPARLNTVDKTDIRTNDDDQQYTYYRIWELESGKCLFDSFEDFDRLFDKPEKSWMKNFKPIEDITKFISLELQGIRGLVRFPQAIIGEDTDNYFSFRRGNFYVIDNKTYYVPRDISIDAMYSDVYENYIMLEI